MNLINDFLGLLFPEACFICGKSLFTNETTICTPCYLHLPETHFHDDADNPAGRIFWGRVPFIAVTALYYYRKGGSAQQLVHKMKYKGHKEIGYFFGNMLGAALEGSIRFQSVDTLMPIPLHRKKLKKRGFNQAELIARGMAEVLNVALDTTSVSRKIQTDTQTKKTRYNRWENVNEIFELKTENKLSGKHILIVDDVITTGATMEALAQTLLRVPGIRLSAAAAAFSYR